MSMALGMLSAVALDAWLGEPTRAHPLVAFGRLAVWIERRLYADRVGAGALAWALAVLPPLLLVSIALQMLRLHAPWLAQAAGALLLYTALGLRSLGQHAQPVAAALHAGELDAARDAVARMVSRDTAPLDSSQLAAAATESVLENGNDAVFGALFWFVLLGAPGAVLYRLANTLDAMWGYRNARYERFGKVAARLDDVLNYLPARLTAASYALCGDARRAWRCWRVQAPQWDSPNAGPVMAAGAGALGVRLGGSAPYHGVWEQRPILGEGVAADARSIQRALRLVRRAVVLWLLVVAMVTLIRELAAHA
jgi:adenosylcobinamide-phosphate synthase